VPGTEEAFLRMRYRMVMAGQGIAAVLCNSRWWLFNALCFLWLATGKI